MAAWLSLAVHAENGPNTVQLFLPTDRANPAPGRSDALRLEMADVDLNQLASVIEQVRPVLPEFSARKPPIVPFYLSTSRTLDERARMLEAARAELRKAFPGIEPRIQVRYLEEEKIDVEAVSRRVAENIDAAAKDLPDDEVTREGVAALHEANRRALRETLAQKAMKPSFVAKVVQGFSSVKALINLVTRGVQVAQAGYQGGAPLLSGLALMGSDAAIEYFATRFEVEIGRAFADHDLPGSRRSRFLSRLNEAYNSRLGKLAKGTVATASVFGVARPALMQLLGHWNNPAVIPMVTGGDLLAMAGASVTSSVLYFGGFQGFETLRQKGWISQPGVDLALRTAGLLWQASEVLFSFGTPTAKAALPFVLGAMWATYGSAFLASYLLPARNRRLVLVDPGLGATHRAEIDGIEALESTKEIAPGELPRAVEEVKELGKLGNPCGWLRRLLGRGKG